MIKARNLKEEIFGGESDCKGMGTGGNKCKELPKEAQNHVPHYHEGEQVDPKTIAKDEKEVTEKELSSHF